jgi:hypothetical protein
MDSTLADTLKTYKCVQATTAKKDGSIYKKSITPMVKAAAEGRKAILNLDDEDKKKNNWQCALDEDGKRLVVMVYHGAYKPPRKLKVVAPNPFDV